MISVMRMDIFETRLVVFVTGAFFHLNKQTNKKTNKQTNKKKKKKKKG